MDQAWLDSLSEDWVSQPRSSDSPPPSLPSLGSSTSDVPQGPLSRIPKYDPQKKAWTPGKDNTKPLIERSPSENNIPSSQRSGARIPSKLRNEILRSPERGRRHSRSLSASSGIPATYNTIQHNKSVSVSPQKAPKETPEWKRRLIHGDVAYGEQRDLFAPAGLESIFAPPPSQNRSPIKSLPYKSTEGSVYMPSSPPPYNRIHERHASQDELEHEQNHNTQQPRGMKYKLADSASSDFSENDLSCGSNFRPNMANRKDGQAQDVFSDSSDLECSALPKRGIMEGAVRMVSGQSELRNEELSPIYISRHNTVDGGIDYAAMDISPDELQKKLDKLRFNHEVRNPSSEGSSQYHAGDMTAESADLPHLGSFVNMRRGGLSNEGSFQKRLLSPSSLPAIDESVLLPENSRQVSTQKELPNVKKTRPVSKTPLPSPSKSQEKPSKSASGSPLKLFGTYDTFTNQKLLRRLSQFEEHFDGEVTEQELPSTPGPEMTRPEMNEAFVVATSSRKADNGHGRSRKFSSFGEGELDDFRFEQEFSIDSNGSNPQDDDTENMSLPILDPRTQTRFRFQLDPSPALDGGRVVARRTEYDTTSTTKHIVTVRSTCSVTASSEDSPDVPSFQIKENLATPRKRNGDSEGKRLPKSPLKDPTPKRRRTLPKIDLMEQVTKEKHLDLDSLKDTHQQMQSVIGRKRKDAKHGDSQQAANPKVLAMRQILRPRTPTPNQRSSVQHEREPLHELDLFAMEHERLQKEKIARVQADLDTTDALRLPHAFAVGQQMQNDSRKGSVTTQDFLDEAKAIMSKIRDHKRPRSGLNSVEESELENDRNKGTEDPKQEEVEDSYQESTQEPFSRPPSREGAPVSKNPLRQHDPEVLNHLRKYQEVSDLDGFIASSMRSVAMAQEAAASAREITRMAEETLSRASGRLLNEESISEPPDIRIMENPEMQRKRKHSSSSGLTTEADLADPEILSQGSNASSGQSTTRSIATGSSRGSDSRRVIPPEAVAHLLPEQLAGMFLDKERNIWVKKKVPSEAADTPDMPRSDESEDDPFGDIPDLSVDETQEMQRVKAAKRHADTQHDSKRCQVVLPVQMFLKSPRSLYRENEPSSEPSRLTKFASSGSIGATNTRATSWGDELVPIIKKMETVATAQTVHHSQGTRTTQVREEIAEEIEMEISINEGRVEQSTPPRQRKVTISFSSPLASIIETTPYQNDSSLEHEASQMENESDEDFGDDSVIIHKRGSEEKTNLKKACSAYRNASARLSVGGHTFSARPVSRIEERDEKSIIADDDKIPQRSISIVVPTPVPSRQTSGPVQATPRLVHEIGTLSLTPMSDFTVHRENESFGLEVSYIAGKPQVPAKRPARRTLSSSIKELVEKITEVEPYEPYWENLTHIELRDKRLTSLHKLDEFCRQIEDMDVGRNQISQLTGAPWSLRNLQITHNYLSDLTSWGHLSNLQYIDVSNNDLESLSGFSSLVHLRSLTADNNRIKSLRGIGNLDGLLELRLRGNMVESLDFAGTGLSRLIELDMRDNHVHEVKNFHDLKSLIRLDLENNELSEFTLDTWSCLRYLKLSGNDLESIDVSYCPDLRLLYLDRNRMSLVTGLLRTKHMDSLSLREQKDGTIINPFFLDEVFELRKLFRSGNLLRTFQPKVEFLNLQYLELANCGLQSLPAEFGRIFANTRVLNLNFNALRDITPLCGIVRLKKLYLAGNRLVKIRKTASVLSHLRTLSIVDIRSNLMTQGFYSPILENRLVKRDGSDEMEVLDGTEPFTLNMADREKDKKYAGRLDMDTKMLRRVYEFLMLNGCERLKVLDGLAVDRSVLSLNDDVWQALLDGGFVEGIPRMQGEHQEGEDGERAVQEPELRPVEKSVVWQAEDSFA